MPFLTTATLYIILIAPNGTRSESSIDMDRATCRVEKAWTHAAMRADPKGYVLVSADCVVVK